MNMMELGAVKKDFSNLLAQVQPWTLSHFVMWLDIKVAEYKVFGRMIMDNTPNDTPQWLRASADYLEQQQKEAQAQAAAQGDKDLSPTVPTVPPPPLSPRTAHAMASLRPSLQQITSQYEPVSSFMASSASALYTVSTVNSTVVSPSVSPTYSVSSQVRPPTAVDSVQKSATPISTSEVYAKSNSMAQYVGYSAGSQRIPPISHLSPKHIRQTHLEQGLSMSLPVSLASGKESLTTAEVESQIAVLESQIAAVNRSLKQSAQVTGILDTPTSTTGKSGRRKADTTTDDTNSFVPPPYPKKSRQHSPVSAVRTTSEATSAPALHASMDMLARMHRLDTESIPESLRSQNIQSTLEAFEALRTQTFPPSVAISNDVDGIQNTAQDMSMHHAAAIDRDQLAAYTAAVEREQTYSLSDREQTYTPTSDTTGVNAYSIQSPEIRVKVEANQSDEDSRGGMEGLKIMTPDVAGNQEVHELGEDGQTYPVSMYAAAGNNNTAAGIQDEKLAAEISTKKMRRKFLESMKNSNPKYYSHQIQQIIPFPDKFPVSNLDYGLKALQMIQTGEITRAGKIQLIDTIFHELIKYTGLYPTPTQKMAVANAIVETFPTLAAKMKASHISPADSWYVILCDKFRNERRGLGGAGSSPRAGRTKKEHHEAHSASGMAEQQIVIENTDDTDLRGSEDMQPESGEQLSVTSVSQATPPHYDEAVAHAYQYPTATQVTPLKDGGTMPEMSTEEEEEEASTSMAAEHERLAIQTEERRGHTERARRAVRRKTHSPKRHQKQPAAEMPILDERYAASLLEYYSKHKPYYPVDTELSREAESIKTNAAGVLVDEKGNPIQNTAVSQALAQVAASQQAAVSQAIAQAVASHAVGNPDEPYSAEVAAIVQNVVSAHMDEVLAARNYQIGPDLTFPMTSPAPEMEGTIEVKTSSKKKPKIQQKERTPEQQQVTLQRFKQKLAVTYPGVQTVDDSTLLCTCGAKVKLGRARMLHNYSNYHLKRCNNPPITVTMRHDGHSPVATQLSYQGLYGQGSPGEINIPSTGPKVITKEMESAAFAGLSAADRETIQKHFLLNIPTPSSDNTLVAGSTSSTPPSQSLDLSMPVTGHSVLNIPSTGHSITSGQNGLSVSESMTESMTSNMVSDITPSVSVLNVPLPGQSSSLLENSRVVTEASSVTDRTQSELTSSRSLDLSVQTSSSPSVLIEHQPGSHLRVQIPSSIASSIAEYSGELPDLSAMNALALIQGKTDQPIETSDTNDQGTTNNEEPINLADT